MQRFSTNVCKQLMLALLVVAGMLISSSAYAQNKSVTVNLDSRPLSELIKAVESKTGMSFVYESHAVDTKQPVSVNLKNASVDAVLAAALNGSPLSYSIKGNKIMLFPKASQKANPVTITGQVIDQSGQPVIGASVFEKNTNNGTVADLDGNFTLRVSSPSSLVSVSSIGFLTKDVRPGKGSLKVVLDEDLQNLEAAVFIGYGSQKRLNLTGAVATVDSKVIEDRPLTSLMAGLQGTIGNLNITQTSGEPGTEPTYNVRGNTNLDGTSALVLVDGVEMDPSLVNPEDIQDVVVLKDAASAAIYGAKAAFGVILITTKGGQETKKPSITFTGNYAFNTPTTWYKSMSSLERADYLNMAFQLENGENYYDTELYDAIKAHNLDPVNNPSRFMYGWETNEEANHYCGNTDWNNALNKRWASQQRYNVKIRGGNKSFKYYSSLGYYTQDGLTKWYDDKYEKITQVNNFTFDVTKWLEMGVKTQLSFLNRDDSAASSTYVYRVTDPLIPVLNPDGTFAGINNPAQMQAEGGWNRKDNQNLLTTGTFKITPFKGMEINGSYTFNFSSNETKIFHDQYYSYDAYGNVDGIYSLEAANNSSAISYRNTKNKRHVLDLYAQYKASIAGRHNISAMVGFNQEYFHTYQHYLKRLDVSSDMLPYVSASTGDMTMSDRDEEVAMRGVFYRFGYNFKERYLLEVNGRYDGSSRFPTTMRFKMFPSVSAGWRISQEPFWEPLSKAVPEFKIRGSWGSLGNQAISDYYPYYPTYSTQTNTYLFNGTKERAAYPPGIVDTNMTWETVTTLDFGFDAAFFNNKLTANFDWYERNTTDMVTASRTLPAILGTGEPQTNGADLKVNGWEAKLEWSDALASGFRYNISATVSDYHGVITRFDNPNNTIGSHYVGEHLGEIWGFKTDGFVKIGEEIAPDYQSQIYQFEPVEGDLKLTDIDNSGRVTKGQGTIDDHGDMVILGNSTPRYSFGIRGGFQYKGVDFTLFLQGVGKRQVCQGYFLEAYASQWGIPLADAVDYWTPENTDAKYPRPRTEACYNDEALDFLLCDASYLRVKNVALGYTFPQKWTRKANIEKLRIYFNADNALSFHKMGKYIDPEVPDALTYPLNKSFSFGINVTL